MIGSTANPNPSSPTAAPALRDGRSRYARQDECRGEDDQGAEPAADHAGRSASPTDAPEYAGRSDDATPGARTAQDGWTTADARTAERPDYDAACATTLYSVSRWTGSRPAAAISRAISLVVIDSGVRAPAMW